MRPPLLDPTGNPLQNVTVARHAPGAHSRRALSFPDQGGEGSEDLAARWNSGIALRTLTLLSDLTANRLNSLGVEAEDVRGRICHDRNSMTTDREQAERVADLLRQADRLRVPGHRYTVEQCMQAQDEIRAGLRRLYRDMFGTEIPRETAPRRPVLGSFQAGSLPGTRTVVAFRGRPKAVAARA